MIKCAIFDLDGTLIDSMGYWNNVHIDLLKQYGISTDEDIARITMSMSDLEAAEYIKNKFNLSFTKEEIDASINKIMEEHYKKDVQMKEGMRLLLDTLNFLGINMGIATATEPYLVDIALKAQGIDMYFNDIESCYTIGVSKNKPDVYVECAKKLGYDINEAVIFEDLPYGLISSKEVGATTIGLYDINNEYLQDKLKEVSDMYIEKLDFLKINEIIKFIQSK